MRTEKIVDFWNNVDFVEACVDFLRTENGIIPDFWNNLVFVEAWEIF
jgi:dsDNA-specific endonuclease/ATPase MutS2